MKIIRILVLLFSLLLFGFGLYIYVESNDIYVLVIGGLSVISDIILLLPNNRGR